MGSETPAKFISNLGIFPVGYVEGATSACRSGVLFREKVILRN